MPPVKSVGERIADALMEDGLLSTKQVEELLELQKKEGTRLLKLLIEKSYVNELDMVVAMGRVLNTPPINLPRVGVPPEIASLIPKDMATNHKVLPVSRMENRLYVAMADPLNVLALDDVKRHTKMDVIPMIAAEKAIIDKINNIDPGKGGSLEEIVKQAAQEAELEAEAAGAEIVADQGDSSSVDELAAAGEEAPVIKLANLILVQAIKDKASDIHIEPFEKMVRLRYRI